MLTCVACGKVVKGYSTDASTRCPNKDCLGRLYYNDYSDLEDK